jgi:hypothetical protein
MGVLYLTYVFWKCGSLSRTSPWHWCCAGGGVLTVVGHVSCVTYPVFAMLHFHRGTGVKLALQLTAALLLF